MPTTFADRDTGDRRLGRLYVSGSATWSADGRKIVSSRETTLHVMDANGRRVRRLTHGQIDDSPAWRPAA